MLEIKYKSIDDLLPYARNSRTHSDAQVSQIAASIREFGFTNPVLIDEHGSIIAGHGRVMAARKLKLTEVPTITLSHLSETQRRAYVIADNKLALNAGWDEELLRIEIEALKGSDFDISLLGFDDDELNNLFPEEIPPGLTDEDEVPETPADPITKLGDVWILGKHRLMCGDSTSIDAVDTLMAGQKADMVFTDPPYALFGNSTGMAGVADDKMIQPFFRDIFGILYAISKQYAHIYVCCDWHSAFTIEGAARKIGITAKNLCIWDKGDGGMGNMYTSCYEMVWFFENSRQTGTAAKSGAGKRIVEGKSNIWRHSRVHASKRDHNAQKPVELVVSAIENSSDAGGFVLDLFGGSGTTIIAAEKSRRCAALMEMEPKYCDVIVKRWQEFTGKKAKLESNGKSFDDLSGIGVAEAA